MNTGTRPIRVAAEPESRAAGADQRRNLPVSRYLGMRRDAMPVDDAGVAIAADLTAETDTPHAQAPT
ncbi:hypothetical protein GCM10009801_72050 [Streptomyces albiaxialis]|uniref:Uncharacterized protein n=1 Tax=Streptomyces albiaxialis TaxID=329523 RepID=A0ABP5IK93_9ACTN